MDAIYIILNLMFSTASALIFFYIYKRTHLYVMLLAGTLSYIELLFRTFLTNITIQLIPIDYLIIPEMIIMLYMAWYIYKDGFKWIPIGILTTILATILLVIVNHEFFGDIGVIFGMLMLLWLTQSTRPCTLNPFESCKQDQTLKERW